MQFHFNSTSFPPLHLGPGRPPELPPRSSSPRLPGQRSAPGPALEACGTFNASARMQVSADHEPSRLSRSWTTEGNSCLAADFSENRIGSVTRTSKQKVRHYKLVSLGRLRTFRSSPSRRNAFHLYPVVLLVIE